MEPYSFTYLGVDYDNRPLEETEVKAQRINLKETKQIQYHNRNGRTNSLTISVENGIMSLVIEKDNESRRIEINYEQYKANNNDGAYIYKSMENGEQYLVFNEYRVYETQLVTIL